MNPKINKIIPITILTGFLGSGKTTLVNKLVKENPETKFALIINEFGEVGVDGELVKGETTGPELVTELSDGCLCCVVRSDLLEAVAKLIENNVVDHILIETSGLAEPEPVANTFLADDLGGRICLQAVVCMIDAENFNANIHNYGILQKQVTASDIAIINKLDETKVEFNLNLKALIKANNPAIAILENTDSFSSKILIDSPDKVDSVESLYQSTHSHEHQHDHNDHSHHNHEHEDFSEVIFSTYKQLDPNLLDELFLKNIPANLIRIKGFISIKGSKGLRLFQMVGARKELTEYTPSKESKIDAKQSFLVMIGKDLDAKVLIDLLKKCEV